MTRKDGQPAEESFTLQFGETEGQSETDEVVTSVDAVVDDHFMWNNAAALLEQAWIEPVEKPLAQVEAPVSKDATARGPSATLSFPDGGPLESTNMSVDETLVADASDDVSSAQGAEAADLDEDADQDDLGDDLVLDERQIAMVSAPDISIPSVADGSMQELRADPSAAVTPRDPAPVAAAEIEGGLFADEHDIDEVSAIGPVARSSQHGRKAPWVIYGTLGLGVSVVAVAAIGMVLQVREPVGPGVFVAQTEALFGGSSVGRDADIDVQLQVFRLAVGPLVENDAGLFRPQIDEALSRGEPVTLALAQPDRDFVADLGATPLVSVATEPAGNFGVSAEETSVVTLSQDRIELDLSDGGEAGIGLNDVELSTASTSLTIDPKIAIRPAPELISADADALDAPAEEFAARSLFEAVALATDDIARLDGSFVGVSAELNDTASFSVVSNTATATAPRRTQAPVFVGFDVAIETSSALIVPRLPRAPLAAVRLVSADSRVSPDDRTADSLFGALAPAPVPVLEQPSRIARAEIPSQNLPQPRIDVSGALLMAANSAEAKAARLRAEEAELLRKKEASEEAVRVATAAAVQAVRPQAEVQGDLASVGQDRAAAPAPEVAQDLIVPVQATVSEPAKSSGEWVVESRWVPTLGFSIVEAIQNGRGVLEVVEVDDESILPAWASKGSSIVSVNGIAVEGEAAFLDAMLSEVGDTSNGEVDASFMIRARPGLNPRNAKIAVPVKRLVQLGDGTQISVRLLGRKWVSEVVSVVGADPAGLQVGDVLLRDFMTKSNLRTPTSLEDLLAKMTEAGETRVEFALMRGGELASGGASLAR